MVAVVDENQKKCGGAGGGKSKEMWPLEYKCSGGGGGGGEGKTIECGCGR